MLTRYSAWLQEKSTGKITVIALVVFILFTALVLPSQAAIAEENTNTAESPDTSFFYTAQDLYRMAEEYGEEGRAAYILARFTFDVVWPVIYTFFLLTALSWLGGRLFNESKWTFLNMVPLLGALFDYLENIGASVVFSRFPTTTPLLDILTPVFTLLKWVFIGGSFVILAVEAAAVLWKTITER